MTTDLLTPERIEHDLALYEAVQIAPIRIVEFLAAADSGYPAALRELAKLREANEVHHHSGGLIACPCGWLKDGPTMADMTKTREYLAEHLLGECRGAFADNEGTNNRWCVICGREVPWNQELPFPHLTDPDWLGTPDGEAAVIEAMRKLNYNVRRRFIRALQAETRSASRDGGTAWTPLYMTPDAVCLAAAAALREGNDG